jgi:hypothetical protein
MYSRPYRLVALRTLVRSPGFFVRDVDHIGRGRCPSKSVGKKDGQL